MEVKFKIEYDDRVVKEDIPKAYKTVRNNIRKVIQTKLTTEPIKFGKPLRYSLKGHRLLRVGVYRVVYRVEKRTVKIFCISHRQISYKETLKRI